MNEIINKFLLVGDKFMAEMHLRQPGFTYSACGLFTKNKERIDKFMRSGNTVFIYKNEYQRGLASIVYKIFDKKFSGSGITNELNYKLANELHKPIIKKFKKEKFIHLLKIIYGV